MAVIVHSSARNTILRAFSSEGTFSVGLPQSGCRLITTTSTGGAGGSNVNESQVDQLVKKVENVATKATLVEYTRSLAQEQKMGFRLPYILATSSIVFLWLVTGWVLSKSRSMEAARSIRPKVSVGSGFRSLEFLLCICRIYVSCHLNWQLTEMFVMSVTLFLFFGIHSPRRYAM